MMLALVNGTVGLYAETPPVALSSLVRGRSAESGGSVTYSVTVSNTCAQAQAVKLTVERIAWAAMTATVEPPALELSPNATTTVVMRVTVPARVPPGGHEPQTLRATPGGALKCITARRLAYPNILFTKEGWDKIRATVEKHDWARQQAADTVVHAERWGVPGVRNPNNPQRGDWLFQTQVENDLMAAGIAYELTGRTEFAEKVRTFMLRLSDPVNGFPVTRRGCHQSWVQEGHFFQHIAMAYDMAIPSGVFTEADRAQIDETLRLFVGEERDLGSSNISNWIVSTDCGMLYCALVVQDLGAADWVLHTPGGGRIEIAAAPKVEQPADEEEAGTRRPRRKSAAAASSERAEA